MKTRAFSQHRRNFFVFAASAAALPGTAWALAGPNPAPDTQLPLLLSGRLLQSDGKPLPGARIDLASFFQRPDDDQTSQAMSDADGRFLLDGAAIRYGAAQGTQPLRLKIRHPSRAAEYFTITLTPNPRLPEARLVRSAIGDRTVRASLTLQLA
jgi:hypothetical protein